MSFTTSGFMCGRGTANSEATTTAPAYHSYKTTDNIADIETASYFPANFDFQVGDILDGDVLFIYAADGNNFYVITNASIDPTIEVVGA